MVGESDCEMNMGWAGTCGAGMKIYPFLFCIYRVSAIFVV
jgi:hypothetical protein